ncbi:zinc finger protein 233-like [Anoplophora glabripennis]|uniref:zinc finger protein 233-like n=1 Tax=Anoplophora glabripennis TaxID=217634 RepID=UPI00087589FB|nr:zinc finger protein 233-like [Anoplophora glabripennis]
MEICKGIFCKLCISTVSNENFTVIEESTREILKTVSLKLGLDNYKNVMCSTCSYKLYSAFDFKSTCLYVEDKIVSYVNPTLTFVDLREVYLKDQENKPSVNMENDQKIYRLCLQLVSEGGFISFYEVKLEVIRRCLPDMNFGITEDPVICRQCFDKLNIHDAFIRTCLDVQSKIYNRCDDTLKGFEHIKRENNEIKLEQMKEGLIKNENYLEMDEALIETEEINIKFEKEEWESNYSLYDVHNEAIKNKMKTTYDIAKIENEDIDVCDREVQVSKPNVPFNAPSYNSDYKNECNSGLEQEAAPGLTHRKKSSKSHNLILRDLSKARTYKCNTCDYVTKYRGDLRRHQLSHKDPSEIQMYKCDTCNYESKRRCDLKNHQLTHKDTSEIQMYKCDTCTYETKYKKHLKPHQLTHKDSSEIQMYKCDACTYESKFKRNLKLHQLTHKDSSEIRVYHCDTCTFQTKHKHRLKYHQLLHKDPSEIQMHKCDTCSFETKYKRALKVHQLIHKDPSEVQMYTCGKCNFKTKYRDNIKSHLQLHENPSTAQTWEGDTLNSTVGKQYPLCNPSIYPTQVQVYRCNECVFESTYKQSLRNHILKHRDPSKVQMHKCDKCVFQTRHKRSLPKHRLTHKDSSVA